MTVSHRCTARRLAVVGLAASLSACSSVDNMMGGEKIDYRTAGTARERGLEVPPDLSQLGRDSRFQAAGGSVSAAEYQAGAASAATPATPSVAPTALDDARIERQGNTRWLVVGASPEQVWPKLQEFWKQRGFTLAVDQPQTGVMETDWAENRAKIPQDPIRNTIGRVLDSLYSTGERDKFRTRVERTAEGSEIYLTHRGMEEVLRGDLKDSTIWQPRASDPQLEAEMLQRLMIALGGPEAQAKAAPSGAAAPPLAARARLVEGRPGPTLEVDDGFDRAWRRVGLALDRSGFTVEDRDRAQGVYYVRYVDPALAGREEPGFLKRLFSFGRDKDADAGPKRYRVQVKGDGASSTVTVLDAQGQPESGEAGRRIASLLLDDLR